jgi:hypothetical protein
MSARANNEIFPSPAYRTAWTTTPVDYDIRANDPTRDNTPGRPCRQIVIATAGTLVVTGPDGTDVTLPSGPLVWDIQAIALVASGTTAQGVVVLW